MHLSVAEFLEVYMETFWPEVAARDRCCGLMPSRLHELLDGLLKQKRASARLTGHVEDEFNVLKLGSPACDGLNDKKIGVLRL